MYNVILMVGLRDKIYFKMPFINILSPPTVSGFSMILRGEVTYVNTPIFK